MGCHTINFIYDNHILLDNHLDVCILNVKLVEIKGSLWAFLLALQWATYIEFIDVIDKV